MLFDKKKLLRFVSMMLRLRNSFTAFFLVAVCLVELCLLNVSSGESPLKGEFRFKITT